MSIIELLLLGVALAMDAFAASLCRGVAMGKPNYRNIVIIALFFGVFQAIMPLIGYLVGAQFERLITAVDHWIAFGLLAFIGVKMIIEAIKSRNEETECSGGLNIKELLILSLATSIDALAAGVTLACEGANIVYAAGIIGLVTFALCFVGCLVGCRFGDWLKTPAAIAGGAVLILLGVKILLEHMGVFSAIS